MDKILEIAEKKKLIEANWRLEDLDDYRYFAIQARDTRDYRYDFEKSHNDLYIYIYDK